MFKKTAAEKAKDAKTLDRNGAKMQGSAKFFFIRAHSSARSKAFMILWNAVINLCATLHLCAIAVKSLCVLCLLATSFRNFLRFKHQIASSDDQDAYTQIVLLAPSSLHQRMDVSD